MRAQQLSFSFAPKKNRTTLKDIIKSVRKIIDNHSHLTKNKRAPLVIGILLALRSNLSSFNIDTLYQSIKDCFTDNPNQSNVLTTFDFIKSDKSLFEAQDSLNGQSLVDVLAKKLKPVKRILEANKDTYTVGDFCSNFVEYNGSDGNSLGIVMTPYRITKLMCELIDVKPTDCILDPVTGSGIFLVSALSEMLKKSSHGANVRDLVSNHLCGIEADSGNYAVATSNMILRGGNGLNMYNMNFFDFHNKAHRPINKIVMNPPYSQGTKHAPEIRFIKHGLELLHRGGLLCAIVPISIGTDSGGTGVTKSKMRKFRSWLINHCQIEDVISMNPDTFYPTNTQTIVMVIKKTSDTNKPVDNPKTEFAKDTRLINFTKDGYHLVAKHGVQPVTKDEARQKYAELVDIVLGHKSVSDSNKVLNHVRLKMDNGWIFNANYTNPNPPTEKDFQKTIADYLTFKTDMMLHGRGYLFRNDDK